ncbi:MAG: HPr family phosphocarrier protein [Gammaproteobacteria bacterium]|nr:HPr family phosphocarrier protein [Gammaproteobacteria bacterium]
MAVREIPIVNKLGLHARAAAKLVQVASHYEANITLQHNGKEVSGKSIMGVMMLAAGMGSTISVIASGPDEEAALDEIENLIRDRFGESE